jgi:hypothetical protein
MSWVQKWISFIEENYPLPDEIDNFDLKQRIVDARSSIINYNGMDNALALRENEDYVIFSALLWKFFFDNYGVKHII